MEPIWWTVSVSRRQATRQFPRWHIQKEQLQVNDGEGRPFVMVIAFAPPPIEHDNNAAVRRLIEVAVRAWDELIDALDTGLIAMTAQDAAAFYANAGFPGFPLTPVQSL